MVLIFSLFIFLAIRGREFLLFNHARETHAHDIGDKCSKKNANYQKILQKLAIFRIFFAFSLFLHDWNSVFFADLSMILDFTTFINIPVKKRLLDLY